MFSSLKYNHIIFKPINFGFMYVIYPRERIFQVKARDASRNEEDVQIKSKTLCYASHMIDIDE